jgi:hypothetical protein
MLTCVYTEWYAWQGGKLIIHTWQCDTCNADHSNEMNLNTVFISVWPWMYPILCITATQSHRAILPPVWFTYQTPCAVQSIFPLDTILRPLCQKKYYVTKSQSRFLDILHMKISKKYNSSKTSTFHCLVSFSFPRCSAKFIVLWKKYISSMKHDYLTC